MKVDNGSETPVGGKPFSAADNAKKKAPADLQLTDVIYSKSFYTAFEKYLIEKDKDTSAPPVVSSSSKAGSRASRGSFGNHSIKSSRVIQYLYCLRLIARIEGETAISTNPATSNVDKIVAGTESSLSYHIHPPMQWLTYLCHHHHHHHHQHICSLLTYLR